MMVGRASRPLAFRSTLGQEVRPVWSMDTLDILDMDALASSLVYPRFPIRH